MAVGATGVDAVDVQSLGGRVQVGQHLHRVAELNWYANVTNCQRSSRLGRIVGRHRQRDFHHQGIVGDDFVALLDPDGNVFDVIDKVR